MNKTEWLTKEISRRYGNIRRSRGCYLYTEKGRRLTDCYLDNGRAILGWDGGKARTVFKDTLERGANGSYVAGYEQKLITAVKQLLPPEYAQIRWWNDATVAGAFSLAGISADSAKEISLWRPWLNFYGKTSSSVTGYNKVEAAFTEERPAVIKLIPPFPWAGTPCIYAFKTTEELPSSDIIAAPLLAGMARAFYDLKLAFGIYGENQFKCFSKQLEPYFERKGCYLFPKISRENYSSFVLAALDNGIVLSPDYDIPSVVPWKANAGDIKKIALAGNAITAKGK